MTTKPIAITAARDATEQLAKFPEFPPRDDMQNTKYIYSASIITALMNYLGDSDSVYVGSEIPLGWKASVRKGVLIPDLMVALNCDAARIDGQDGYEMRSQPNPPEFALEVASVHTAERDYTEKRVGYADYGVSEYWRFDPTDGDRYPEGLAGDRLVGGAYEPIELEYYGENNKRGYSEALGLYVCWEVGEREYGELRLYDPMSENYLRTHGESEARAADAIARADYADARADAEANTRRNEAARADYEAEARRIEATRAAEAEARAAEAAARAAEAEVRAEAEAEARRQADALIRQLQEQLAQQRGDAN